MILVDIEGMTEKLAAELIMAARAPWFVDDESGSKVIYR